MFGLTDNLLLLLSLAPLSLAIPTFSGSMEAPRDVSNSLAERATGAYKTTAYFVNW